MGGYNQQTFNPVLGTKWRWPTAHLPSWELKLGYPSDDQMPSIVRNFERWRCRRPDSWPSCPGVCVELPNRSLPSVRLDPDHHARYIHVGFPQHPSHELPDSDGWEPGLVVDRCPAHRLPSSKQLRQRSLFLRGPRQYTYCLQPLQTVNFPQAVPQRFHSILAAVSSLLIRFSFLSHPTRFQ